MFLLLLRSSKTRTNIHWAFTIPQKHSPKRGKVLQAFLHARHRHCCYSTNSAEQRRTARNGLGHPSRSLPWRPRRRENLVRGLRRITGGEKQSPSTERQRLLNGLASYPGLFSLGGTPINPRECGDVCKYYATYIIRIGPGGWESLSDEIDVSNSIVPNRVGKEIFQSRRGLQKPIRTEKRREDCVSCRVSLGRQIGVLLKRETHFCSRLSSVSIRMRDATF